MTATTDVVIPCHNYGDRVGRAIASALAQVPRPRSVFVVDDGSTDDICSVVEHSGAIFIRQEHLGLAAARNEGLRRSDADHVVFLDADDELLPGAIRAGLQSLDARPDVAFTCGRFLLSDGENEREHHPVLGDDAFVSFLRGNQAGAIHAVMFRRRELLEVGGFRPFVGCEDYDAYLRLARRRGAVAHTAFVARYHVHGAGMSRDHLLMLESALACLADTRRQAWESRYEAPFRDGIRAWKARYGPAVVRDLARAVGDGNARHANRCVRALLYFHAVGLWAAVRRA